MDIKEKVDALSGIRITIYIIEKSAKVVPSKYDKVFVLMAKQLEAISDLRKRVLWLEVQDKEKVVERLQRELNELYQYSRRLNLEVIGLSYHKKKTW